MPKTSALPERESRDGQGAAHGVAVYEEFKNFSPPVRVAYVVQGMLGVVAPEALTGLQSIVLTNQSALSPKQQRRRLPKGVAKGYAVGGLYHSGNGHAPAWIELFLDNIFGGKQRWILRLPLVRDVLLAPALFHEIGHHIDFASTASNRDRESGADHWKKALVGGDGVTPSFFRSWGSLVRQF
ncbi:MAG: hypothetical protein WA208_15045 [Thermoanaerobaculia bacterium]